MRDGSWFTREGAIRGCSGVVATNSQSWATSELTRGGRQLVRPVGTKHCLAQILLWRSNRELDPLNFATVATVV
jgi:hypothetical protein